MDHFLMLAALRVLKAHLIEYTAPDPADVNLLRAALNSDDEPDALACQIIERERQKVHQQPGPRTARYGCRRCRLTCFPAVELRYSPTRVQLTWRGRTYAP